MLSLAALAGLKVSSVSFFGCARKWLQGRRELLLLIVLGCAALLCFIMQYRLNSERAAHARDLAAHAQAVARSEAEARTREAAMAARVIEATQDLEAARASIEAQDRLIARLRVDARGLREQLSAYAIGPPDDTAAACHARAGTLAGLLAEGAGLVAEGVELARTCAVSDAERAAEVTVLVNGWPR